MTYKSTNPTRRQRLYQNAMRNAEVAARISERGWVIDKTKQAEIAQLVATELTAGHARLNALLARACPDRQEPLNWGSSKQVGWLLYEHLEAPILERTETGAPSTSATTLGMLAEMGCGLAGEIAEALMAWNKWKKLQDAYVNNLKDKDTVHPDIVVVAQVSGRHSYKSPALQTTPPKIKPMFTARRDSAGRGWLIGCDFAGAELRSAAQETGDPDMLRAFEPGGGSDLHAATAEIALGIPRTHPDFLGGEGKPNLRKACKCLSLGYMYSAEDPYATAVGLLPQMQKTFPAMTMPQMEAIVKRLAQARAGVPAWKARVREQCLKEGYTEEVLSGRRREFPGKFKLQEALNFPNQARIAHMVDAAMQGMDAEIYGRGLIESVELRMNRHDEIVLEAKDLQLAFDLLWRYMRQTNTVNDHKMLFEIEYTIWRHWGIDPIVIEPKEDGGCLVFKAFDSVTKQAARLSSLREAAAWAEELLLARKD